jgi:hypothetical protein
MYDFQPVYNIIEKPISPQPSDRKKGSTQLYSAVITHDHHISGPSIFKLKYSRETVTLIAFVDLSIHPAM